MSQPTFNLNNTAVRLRADASAEALRMDATFWPALMKGELGDFHQEFLITQSQFAGRWSQAEMHPNGDEIVCLLEGRCTFVLQIDSGEESISLDQPGEFVIVPPGTWHFAESAESCHLLFITAGENTQHRPLSDK